jgi:hypothetical protein
MPDRGTLDEPITRGGASRRGRRDVVVANRWRPGRSGRRDGGRHGRLSGAARAVQRNQNGRTVLVKRVMDRVEDDLNHVAEKSDRSDAELRRPGQSRGLRGGVNAINE